MVENFRTGIQGHEGDGMVGNCFNCIYPTQIKLGPPGIFFVEDIHCHPESDHAH